MKASFVYVNQENDFSINQPKQLQHLGCSSLKDSIDQGDDEDAKEVFKDDSIEYVNQLSSVNYETNYSNLSRITNQREKGSKAVNTKKGATDFMLEEEESKRQNQ